MFLKELFSQPETDHKVVETLIDDVCFYMMNQDELQKEYFLPAVNELKRKKILDNMEECYKVFTPMAEAGCQKYYEEYKVEGKYEEVFTPECMEGVCKKFTEQQVQYIKDGHYDMER